MLLNKLGRLLVPQHLVEDQKPPVAFMKRLQSIFGRDMHVEWNPKKARWVIEQCVRHVGKGVNADGVVEHDHLCQRVYVWLVRDENDDSYMPLCDRVIEKLHAMETYRKYGVGEVAFERFKKDSENFDQEQQQKQRAMIRDAIRHSTKFNKSTLNRFIDLFRRHDMRPNK